MALSELTAAKLDHGLAALALDQLRGEAPPDGQVSLADIARRAGVSEGTVLKLERLALAKLAAGLMRSDLPPHLARKLSRILHP
jgi:hypothetical protein